MTARPLTLRILLPAAAALIVFPLVCAAAIGYALDQWRVDEQRETLVRTTAIARTWLAANPSPASDVPAQSPQIHAAAAALGARLILTDSSKRILVDTDSPADTVSTISTADLDQLPSAQLIPGRADSARLYLVDRRAQWLGSTTLVALAAGIPAALFVAAIFLFWIRRHWLRPSQKLVHCAEQLSAGQWQSRAQPGGADELQLLASRLNALAGEAQKELADLDGRRAGLQALVDALPDPILLTDSARRIALINAPAAKLFSITPAKALGKKLVSVVTDEAVINLVEPLAGRPRAFHRLARPGEDIPSADAANGHPPTNGDARNGDGQTPQLVEVRLNRDGQRLTYHALGTRTLTGGSLIVLRDVSKMAGAAQMKSDFVANASHELRTPVAAIQVAFETLREVYAEDPDQMVRCGRIIEGNLRRLGDLLGDLLDLSRVESTDLEPDFSTIIFDDLFALVEGTIGPVAAEKGITLICAPNHAPTLQGDRRLLDLVLKNLVDNAIKFTAAGGTVTVGLTEVPPDQAHNGGRPIVVMTVTDTGIGIPPEHLDRVFERFYQVNQGRSGGTRRGTGLGLAIVKHAVHAMGGRIRIESVFGKGTTVICEFPQPDPEESAVTNDSDKLAVSILQSLSTPREIPRE